MDYFQKRARFWPKTFVLYKEWQENHSSEVISAVGDGHLFNISLPDSLSVGMEVQRLVQNAWFWPKIR